MLCSAVLARPRLGSRVQNKKLGHSSGHEVYDREVWQPETANSTLTRLVVRRLGVDPRVVLTAVQDARHPEARQFSASRAAEEGH